mgnify:CR=1 FL=1
MFSSPYKTEILDMCVHDAGPAERNFEWGADRALF